MTGDLLLDVGARASRFLVRLATNSSVITIAAVLALECLLLGWQKSSIRALLVPRSRSARMDLALFGAQILGLMPYLTLAFTLGAGYFTGVVTKEFMAEMTDRQVRLQTGAWWADAVIYLLAASCLEYWNHRLLHTRFLWPLHRMHHSATELNGITSWRNHPALFAWEPFLRMWLWAFLAAPPIVFVLIGAHQFLTHTRLEWSWGFIGRWIVVSPLNHQLHHSSDARHFNRNFSTYLTFWDRLFGTYGGDASPGQPLGLPDDADQRESSAWSLVLDMKTLVSPGRRLYRRIASADAGH